MLPEHPVLDRPASAGDAPDADFAALAAERPLDRVREATAAVADALGVPAWWVAGGVVGFAALLLGAAVVLALTFGTGAAAPAEVDLPMVDQVAPAPAEPIHVHVHAAGAVRQPGLYRLDDGARVADLLDAAGGAAPDADLDRLNLAAAVGDGDRVWVPRVGQPDPGPAGGPGAAPGAGDGPVDLNTATLAELEALPGVGPATAQAIVDWRERHGPFRSVDQLVEVRGIGEAKLEALRDRVTV